MEALTRIVTESLVRHGFDRPLDYRRLHWSRWFRCESVHSLLFVPSKPGVFALAEEVADLGPGKDHVAGNGHVETAASAVPRSEASGPEQDLLLNDNFTTPNAPRPTPALRRMLAVTQFFEDDDMAFVLDRMLSRENPLRARLLSGRYFIRFVTIDDPTQRRSICAALNQWISDAAEKATGIGPHFATSLELTPATEYIPQADERQQTLFGDGSVAREPSPASAESTNAHGDSNTHGAMGASPLPRNEASGPGTNLSFLPSTSIPTSPHLDSGAASNIHCPTPLPSGF